MNKNLRNITIGVSVCIITVLAFQFINGDSIIPNGKYSSAINGRPYVLVLDTVGMTYTQICDINDTTQLINKNKWEFKKGKICFEHWKDFDNLDGRGYNYCEDCCAVFENERIKFFSDPDEDSYRDFIKEK